MLNKVGSVSRCIQNCTTYSACLSRFGNFRSSVSKPSVNGMHLGSDDYGLNRKLLLSFFSFRKPRYLSTVKEAVEPPPPSPQGSTIFVINDQEPVSTPTNENSSIEKPVVEAVARKKTRAEPRREKEDREPVFKKMNNKEIRNTMRVNRRDSTWRDTAPKPPQHRRRYTDEEEDDDEMDHARRRFRKESPFTRRQGDDRDRTQSRVYSDRPKSLEREKSEKDRGFERERDPAPMEKAKERFGDSSTKITSEKDKKMFQSNEVLRKYGPQIGNAILSNIRQKERYQGKQWNPIHKLDRKQMEELRDLRKADPQRWTPEVLSQKYKISFNAVSRILHSKWAPDADTLARQTEHKGTFNQKVFVEKMVREATLLKKVVDMYAEDTNDMEGLMHVISVAKAVLSQARYLQTKLAPAPQTEQQPKEPKDSKDTTKKSETDEEL